MEKPLKKTVEEEVSTRNYLGSVLETKSLLQESVLSSTPFPRLNFSEAKELAENYLKNLEIKNLIEVTKLNMFAVSKIFEEDASFTFLEKEAEKGNLDIVTLFLLLRSELRGDLLEKFRNIAVKTVIQGSFKVLCKERGKIKKNVKYKPGKTDFDEEKTLENALVKEVLGYEDIVGLDKRKKISGGVVLLDVSGSMHGNKIVNAALIASVVTHQLKSSELGLVVFSEKSEVVKGVKEKKPLIKIISEILSLKPIGYTNIENVLLTGLVELSKIKKRDKWGLLITDGLYNRGKPPYSVAKQYPKLHVIYTHGKQDWGRKTCIRLANLGKGKFASVTKTNEIVKEIRKMFK